MTVDKAAEAIFVLHNHAVRTCTLYTRNTHVHTTIVDKAEAVFVLHNHAVCAPRVHTVIVDRVAVCCVRYQAICTPHNPAGHWTRARTRAPRSS